MKAIDQSMNYRMSGEVTLRADKTYIIEPKIDGVRAILAFDEQGVPSLTVATSGNPVRHDLVSDLANPALANTTIDGELVIPGESLGMLVGALNATRRRPVLDRAVFYAFDVLLAAGYDARVMTLEARLRPLGAILERLHEGDDHPFVLPVSRWEIKGDNSARFAQIATAIERAGFEGLMIKDASSIYSDGRSKSWIKVKWLSTLDCFVTGWEPGEGGYSGMVGSLQMSVYDGDEKVEVCSHGVFDLALRQALTDDHGRLDESWYGQVMEVTYQSVGTNLRLRHPRLLRLRPDRTPESCTIDQLQGE